MEELVKGRKGVQERMTSPSPVFCISVAAKGVRVEAEVLVSCLESTFAACLVSVAAKGVRGERLTVDSLKLKGKDEEKDNAETLRPGRNKRRAQSFRGDDPEAGQRRIKMAGKCRWAVRPSLHQAMGRTGRGPKGPPLQEREGGGTGGGGRSIYA